MNGNNITIPVDGENTMSAYLSLPESGAGPGIVLLQEIFGVNDAMKRAADDLAESGFTVLAPDLFWRLAPGIELGYSDDDRQKAFKYWQAFDNETGADDANTALNFLLGHGSCSGKAGFLGFCLGGKLAVMAGAKGDASAIVSFYGVKLQENHDELKSLSCPLQIHVGDDDAHVPMDVVGDLQALLTHKANTDIFVYPGAGHGFFNKMRPEVFDKTAWATGSTRVNTFLRTNLA